MNKPQNARIASGWMVLLLLTTAPLLLLPSVRAQSLAVPREVTLPRWSPLPSPDGRYVVGFGENAEEGAVAIRPLSAGQARRLLSKVDTGQPHAFLWTKDSKRVLYTWCHKLATDPNCNRSVEFELRIISVDGSDARVIVPRTKGQIWPLDTSVDGRYVLARLRDRPSVGTAQLALISVADGTVRELKTVDATTMADLYFSRAGALSPDGRYVAYTHQPRSGLGDIYVTATDGSGAEHALVDEAANDQFIAWAPDGRSILFTSDRAGTTDLWSASVSGGRMDEYPFVITRGIADNGAELEAFAVTANGSLYYRKHYPPDTDVQVVSLEPGTARVLSRARSITTSAIGNNLMPRWSPDGNQIAYQSSSRPGAAFPNIDSISILSVDSWSERRIQPRLHSGVSNWGFTWAPDGRSFLVSVTGAPGTARGLYKVDALTGETTTLLTKGTSYLTHAAWLPDSRSIVFVEGLSSAQVRNLSTNEQRSIYQAGQISQLELSPDGHQLALWARGADQNRASATLTVVDMDGKRAESLVKTPNNRTMTWSADGRSILYFDDTGPDSVRQLWRVPAAGGSPEKLGLTVAKANGENRDLGHPSVRRDGKRLAFTLTRWPPQADYILENVLPIAGIARLATPSVLSLAANRRTK